MKYEEARKSLGKPTGNRMQINFGWSAVVLVPYADGLKILEGLQNAERLSSRHDKDVAQILPFDLSEELTTSILGEEAYVNIKVAKLLGLTYKELQNELNTRSAKSVE
jgi:hypothetical protein